ncbi:GntR family transcriptional regulator [Natranaerofaba carboxydovora]|uniref:GntR family transcriptional regulator n=1 Tax=Natranaerofaba carboxydovora TaxID=2742683 RepID=UPI001F147290|nr:GntR family transcriptional regulator [Natranaerofaba carboxydovora]UMZ74757.1 HTH-type transcriptional repressor YvoA [Natranaerofaba carboxydovora]
MATEKLDLNLKNEFSKLDKTSVIPVYYQVAKILEGLILEEKFGPGEMLPSETKIAELCDISRMTVRKAISELAERGLVIREKGKGTFVSKKDFNYATFKHIDLHDKMRKKGYEVTTKIIQADILKTEDDSVDNIAKKLNLSPGERVLRYGLLSYVEEKPYVFEKKYIPYTKQSPILESDIIDSSLPRLLTLHDKTKTPYTNSRVLKAVILNEEAKHLEIEKGSPGILIEQLIYDKDENPIGYEESIYRGDEYMLVSEDK